MSRKGWGQSVSGVWGWGWGYTEIPHQLDFQLCLRGTARISRPQATAWARGREEGTAVPDDNDDTIKDVVGVLDVAKGAVDEQFQQHLQGKEACEDDVADFQGVGELLGLEGRGR